MNGSAFRQRLPALLLTLALQGGFLALLVYSLQRMPLPSQPQRETILRLPRWIAPRPSPATTIDARGKARPRAFPLFSAPPQVTAPDAAPGSAAPDIRSLGRALFNCAPETYADLSKEQRAFCARPGEGMAMLQPPNLMGSRSQAKDETHWREELAREQSPVILPCLGGLDVLCLLEKVATGKIGDFTDPRTWPHYEVRQIPPEDFYHIEKAYDEWHKAHRESRLAPAH